MLFLQIHCSIFYQTWFVAAKNGLLREEHAKLSYPIVHCTKVFFVKISKFMMIVLILEYRMLNIQRKEPTALTQPQKSAFDSWKY